MVLMNADALNGDVPGKGKPNQQPWQTRELFRRWLLLLKIPFKHHLDMTRWIILGLRIANVVHVSSLGTAAQKSNVKVVLYVPSCRLSARCNRIETLGDGLEIA